MVRRRTGAHAATRSSSPVLAAVTGVALLIAFGVFVAFSTPWGALDGISPKPANYDFTTAQLHRAQSYVDAVRLGSIGGLLFSVVLAGVLGLTPLGARLSPPIRNAFLRSLLTGFLVTVFIAVLTSPWQWWVEHVDRDRGLSTTNWGTWWGLQAEGWAIGGLVTGIVLALLQLVVRRMPRTWWLVFAAGGAGLVFLSSILLPITVEPLTASIKPLPAGPLRESLLTMAHDDGVNLTQIYVSDPIASSTSENAYVSGLGPTARIVLYKTLVDHASTAEIRVVMAHELGHWKHHDIRNGTIMGALGVAGLGCLAPILLCSRRLRRWSHVDGPGDPRAVAQLLGIYAIGALLVTPLMTGISRSIEANADRHSLTLSGDPVAFVASQRSLTIANISQPDPPQVLHDLFGDHPTGVERMALARAYGEKNGIDVPGIAGIQAVPK